MVVPGQDPHTTHAWERRSARVLAGDCRGRSFLHPVRASKGYVPRIILPLSAPGLTVLAIFTFVGDWNALLWPVVVTRSVGMRAVSPGLSMLQMQGYADYGLQMAGSLLAAIPTICPFLALQRYFLRGVTIGALKG